MRTWPRAAFVLSALVLSACATPATNAPQASDSEIEREARLQKKMAIDLVITEAQHVRSIAYPILTKNTDLCPDKGFAAGLAFWNVYDVPEKDRLFVQETFGVTQAIEVQYVLPDAPADKAGLRKGDIVGAVNGRSIPAGRSAHKALAEALQADNDARLDLTVIRNGQDHLVTVMRDDSCAYGVLYDPQMREVNAYADGKNIYIGRGMYRFAQNDIERAQVIAHELAHNIMKHPDKQRQNVTGAGLAGLAVDLIAAYYGVNTQGIATRNAAALGGQAYSVEFEREADYVGMYTLARSGIDTADVANFWRRIASEVNSGAIKTGGTHPSTPERFLSIEKTHQEIMQKKESDQLLTPNLKPKENNVAPARPLSGLNE